MFRTPTGQTGRDAYLFEATAIANTQRELDKRFKRLLKAAHDEHPELFRRSTDWHPALVGMDHRAKHFAAYITLTQEEYREWLRTHPH